MKRNRRRHSARLPQAAGAGLARAWLVAAALAVTALNFSASASGTSATAGVEANQLADQLIREASAARDPVKLLRAMRLIRDFEEVVEPASGGSAATQEASRPTLAQMAAAYRRWAAGDSQLLKRLQEFESVGTRGSLNPTSRRRCTVSALETAPAYPIDFKVGEPALIVIQAEPDSNVDLYVYKTGEVPLLVCASEALGEYERCDWTATGDGRYKVYVVNRGRTEAQCVMRHN